MKVAALLGSPRKNGNSTAMANAFLEQAAQLGAETQIFALNKLTFKGCQGCYGCKGRSETCVVKDGLAPVLEGLSQADIWVVSSPTYFGQISGQLKCCLDRWFSFLKPDYMTNPQPSRLAPGKKAVWCLSQAGPPESFSDIFPLYSGFMKWFGFTDIRLVRATNCGGGGAEDVNPAHLKEAAALAKEWLA